MSNTQETPQETQMRLGKLIDDMLAKEGFEMSFTIMKVAVEVQKGAPPLFMDRPIVQFAPKKSDIIVPQASQDAINKAIQATALGKANGQSQVFPNGMRSLS